MLALCCCGCTCKCGVKYASARPVYRINNNFAQKFYFPHQVSWKCDAVKSDEDGALSRATDDQFYQLFSNLPHEMKLKCLSHCSYFALVNPEMWIDPAFFRRLMQDPHTKMCVNNCMDTFSGVCLSKTRRVVHIGFERTSPHQRAPSSVPRRRRPSAVNNQSPYGSVNRYPSFFYRKFKAASKRTAPTEAARWKLLHSSTGSRVPFQEILDHGVHPHWDDLGKGIESLPKSVYHPSDRYVFPCPSKKLDQVTHAELGPGAYYWEFINHNFEDALATLDADGPQRHFDLSHKTGRPSTHSDRPRTMYFSLMLRRVAHPDAEQEDRFVNLCFFRTDAAKRPNASGKEIYFVLSEEGRDMTSDISPPSNVYEDHTMFRHALTPTFEICVERNVDRATRRDISHFRVLFPTHVSVLSLDQNSTTLRLNFHMGRLTDEDKTAFALSLANQIHSNSDGGYGFGTGQSSTLPPRRSLCKMYDLLYD